MSSRARIRSAVLPLMVVVVSAPGATSQTPPGSKALTPEFALSLRSFGDLQFSPDGSRLLFTVLEPPTGEGRARHVWLLDVSNSAVRQFTFSQKSETSPRWSPDGRQIAFLSDRDDFNQIYLIGIEGGEARALTQGKRSVQGFEWSPDSKQIAFLAPDPRSEAEEKKNREKDDARVVDKDDKHTRAWLVSVASGETRAVTPTKWDIGSLQWTPAGDQLVVSATDHPESDQQTSRIFALTPADSAMRELAAPKGSFGDIRVGPDGKTIYYVGCRVDGPSPHDLMTVPLAGGTARNLTATSLDRPVLHYEWQRDGSLVALAAFGFRNAPVALSPEGARRDLAPLAMDASAFALSHSGQVALVGQMASEPPEIFLWDLKGVPNRVTHVNDPWRQITLGKTEYFRYQSFDAMEIEAGLLTPQGYDGKSKLPLVALMVNIAASTV